MSFAVVINVMSTDVHTLADLWNRLCSCLDGYPGHTRLCLLEIVVTQTLPNVLALEPTWLGSRTCIRSLRKRKFTLRDHTVHAAEIYREKVVRLAYQATMRSSKRASTHGHVPSTMRKA